MHEPDDILTAAGQAEAVTKARIFTDADGVRWRVSEQPFSDYDRRRGASLIFESEAAVRRIRKYPADWYEHTDSQLAQLSWGI